MSCQNSIVLNIAICDDDPAILPVLTRLCRASLEKDYSLQIYASTSPEELLSADVSFHIAVLDVQFGGKQRLDLASTLIARSNLCQIIFVSGFLSSVSAVYDVPHIGMVLKSYLDEDLPKFLLRAACAAAQRAEATLSVHCGKEDLVVLRKDIIYLERRGHWTYITLTNDRLITCREKLSSLHMRLGNSNFLRCHISYIVNLDYVEKLEGQDFYMTGNRRISISRSRKEDSRQAFLAYLNPL